MNVESLVSQAVSQASTLLPDRGRRTSIDSGEPTLSSRNLLCLRALLNLAIALGPTLESSWSIVFETLQQADKVMASSSLRPITRQGSQSTISSSGEPPHLQVIASEVNAIQAAVSRLFESTVDFPNDSFVQILRSLCLFVDAKLPSEETKTPPPTPGGQHRRISSFSRSSITSDSTDKDYIFALSKIRELVSGNVDRFTTNDPAESGWDLFISTTTAVAMQRENPTTARVLAAELLSRLTRDTVSFSAEEEPAKQNEVQCRSLSALLLLCNTITKRSHETDDTANEVHSIALETLRAILEQTGDSLTEGWTAVFSVIGSVFGSPRITEEPASRSSLCTVSLGRSAFGSVQLICSDFLSSVPDASLLTLVETIFQFGSQVQDLNVSLTVSKL